MARLRALVEYLPQVVLFFVIYLLIGPIQLWLTVFLLFARSEIVDLPDLCKDGVLLFFATAMFATGVELLFSRRLYRNYTVAAITILVAVCTLTITGALFAQIVSIRETATMGADEVTNGHSTASPAPADMGDEPDDIAQASGTVAAADAGLGKQRFTDSVFWTSVVLVIINLLFLLALKAASPQQVAGLASETALPAPASRNSGL